MSQPLSRSERNTSFWGCSTPDNVGPGSYEHTLSSPKHVSSKISLASRPRRLFPTAYSPGPAAYNLPTSFRSVSNTRGSSGFVSGQARIAPCASGNTGLTYPSSFSTPGPGTYDVNARPHPNRRQTKRRAPSDVKRTPTSIPVNLPDASETSPVSYMPSLSLVQKRANATAFGASKDRRKLWEPTHMLENEYASPDNPGPGSYQMKTAFQTDTKRGNASFVSRVPLLHEKRPKQRDETPGPGSYNPPAPSGIPHELVAFGSKSKRGEVWANSIELPYTKPERLSVPGVGTYDASYRRRRLKSEAPFSVQQQRDCMTGLRKNELPGPGSYTPELVSERKVLKTDDEKKEKPVTSRFKDGMFEPKPGVAPGAYFRETGDLKGKISYASFKSASERFRMHIRGNTEITAVGESTSPPVGTYDVRMEWGSTERNRQNISFDSSSKRFHPEDNFVGQRKSQTPGPGKYDPNITHHHAAVVPQAQRFASPREAERGPGQYHTENSLVKKSFNYTIHPPRERPQLWTLA